MPTIKQGKGEDYAIIGPGVEVSGQITFNTELQVEGKVTGKIASDTGRLTVGESGEIEAQVEIGICVIHGSVHGDVTARTRIEIHRTGRVNGDMITPALLVEEGAVFNGAVKMSREELEEVRPAGVVIDEVNDKRKIKGA